MGRNLKKEFNYDFGDTYCFEVDWEEVKNEIVNEVFYTYFNLDHLINFSAEQILVIQKALYDFINDNDDWDSLFDYYYETLKQDFENEAYEEYKRG